MANEDLQICREVLSPYLHHGFEACLLLSYHPTAFKHAATVMLRKAGKKSYHAPKSWRPIALLPVVGKVLEKIVTKIRPIISYACPAWFMHIDGVDLKYGITEGLIEKLESLQYQCLVQISGAMKYTSRQVLEKELNVESVRVFLCRLGASQRARALSDPDHGMILQITTPPRWEPLSDAVHPYRILENISQLLKAETLRKLHELNEPSEVSKIWSDPTRQKKAINSHVAHKGQEWSAKLWTSYRRQRAQERKHRTEATDDDWGPMAWSYYKPLTRAQSTMLLHCRTGVIGLNYYLFSIGSRPDRVRSQARNDICFD